MHEFIPLTNIYQAFTVHLQKSPHKYQTWCHLLLLSLVPLRAALTKTGDVRTVPARRMLAYPVGGSQRCFQRDTATSNYSRQMPRVLQLTSPASTQGILQPWRASLHVVYRISHRLLVKRILAPSLPGSISIFNGSWGFLWDWKELPSVLIAASRMNAGVFQLVNSSLPSPSDFVSYKIIRLFHECASYSCPSLCLNWAICLMLYFLNSTPKRLFKKTSVSISISQWEGCGWSIYILGITAVFHTPADSCSYVFMAFDFLLLFSPFYT